MLTLALPDERRWLVANVAVMGTRGEIQLDGSSDHVGRATRRLAELESAWSRFRPDSELERLHARAGRWVSVSDDLCRILDLAKSSHAQTGGWFDPSIRSSLERLGYDRTFRALPAVGPGARRTGRAPGLAGLDVDVPGRRARLEPGLAIDLGGIGKGMAADIVAAEAVRDGARAACIGLGGDIAVAGEPPSAAGWEIPVTHPLTGAVLARHSLWCGGMAMSTTLLRRWRAGGDDQHHLIDPTSGLPSRTGIDAVAVVAASAARAEVLAKAALIAGEDHGREMLLDAGVRAWIVRGRHVERLHGEGF